MKKWAIPLLVLLVLSTLACVCEETQTRGTTLPATPIQQGVTISENPTSVSQPAPSVSEEREVYTAQPNDGLYKIARYYGERGCDITAEQIADKNGIGLNDIIYVNQELVIPCSSQAPIALNNPQPTAQQPPAGEIVEAATPTPTAQIILPTEPTAATAVVPSTATVPEPTLIVREKYVFSVSTPAPTTYYLEDREEYKRYLESNILKGLYTEDSCEGLTVMAFAGRVPACNFVEIYEALGADPAGELVLLYSVGPVPEGEVYWAGFAEGNGTVYLNVEALKQTPTKAAHEIAHRYCQQMWDDSTEECANREMGRAFHIQVHLYQ